MTKFMMNFSIIDDILHELSTSSERIMQVIQEGTSILFDSSSMTKTTYEKVSTAYGFDEEIQHSPLGDIANNVMDELMRGQVPYFTLKLYSDGFIFTHPISLYVFFSL